MDAPPVDLRYIQRGRSSQNPDQVAVRSDVVSFLKSIYESVAECLPDSRDNEFNNVDPLTIPSSGLLDPYCAQLNLEAEQEQKERMFKGLEQQMDKAKKPRKKKKGVEMNLERTAGETGVEEKWLPPGKMKEYYTQYTVVSGLPKAASFPCFWKIWVQEFYMLRFREESQHAECSMCVRHRTMIRLLAGHYAARKAQVLLFQQHLRAQYSDRMLYWESRGVSRLKGDRITLIGDAMDMNKFAIPRSAAVMRGKEFSTFQRVKLSVSCVLAHGHFALFVISMPGTKKDSNATCEIFSHALTLLEANHSVHLPQATITFQYDNTPREWKNNGGLRFCAARVSAQRVGAIHCSYLRSGHTHEDIDAVFAQLGKFMIKQRRLLTPSDVKSALQTFCSDVLKLPFEPARYVVFLDNVRDWKLVTS